MSEEKVKKPKTYDSFKHDFEEMKLAYKHSQNALDLKKADQLRQILKTKIKDDEDKVRELLVYERSRHLINVPDTYYLNFLEQKEIKEFATCYRKLPAGAFFEEVGKSYPFKNYFDESKECEVFVFFIDRTISPQEQISKELAWKISQGFMPNENDYAQPKIVWNRFSLVEKEFKKYFRIDE